MLPCTRQRAQFLSKLNMSLLRNLSPLSVSDFTESLSRSIAVDGMDLSVLDALQQGIEILKVSDKKEKHVVFKLNPDAGIISYQSSKCDKKTTQYIELRRMKRIGSVV